MPVVSLSLSLPLSLYVHSRGIARRREGTTIIYESRKSRSIDLSDRSRSLARTLVRTRSNVVSRHSRKHFDERCSRIWCNYHGYRCDTSGIIPSKHNIARATYPHTSIVRVHIYMAYICVPATTWSKYYSSSTALCCSFVTIYSTLLLFIRKK